MKNNELISILIKLPQDAEVDIHDNGTGFSYAVEDVIMASGEVSIGFRFREEDD